MWFTSAHITALRSKKILFRVSLQPTSMNMCVYIFFLSNCFSQRLSLLNRGDTAVGWKQLFSISLLSMNCCMSVGRKFEEIRLMKNNSRKMTILCSLDPVCPSSIVLWHYCLKSLTAHETGQTFSHIIIWKVQVKFAKDSHGWWTFWKLC